VVDNRSAGFYGIGGSFNFKSGDPSGSAAKMSQEKYGSEAMYLPPVEGEEEFNMYSQPYVDRSALLRATLTSLAMTNVAAVLNSQKYKKKFPFNKIDDEDLDDNIKTLDDVFKEEEEEEDDDSEINE